MAVPVLAGNELMGEIAVANAQAPYTSQDLVLLKRMADILAIAIERKRLDDEIQRLALVDPLTQLANRRGFTVVAEKQLKIAERLGAAFVVIFIDLDGMKWINDNLGHQAGDQALIETARLLQTLFRSSDSIARIGGDEFVVLAMENNAGDAEPLIGRLQSAIRLRNEQGDLPFQLSISTGMVRYDPSHPMTLEALLAEADRRMYADKCSRNAQRQ